jgi:hypothetical protein
LIFAKIYAIFYNGCGTTYTMAEGGKENIGAMAENSTIRAFIPLIYRSTGLNTPG